MIQFLETDIVKVEADVIVNASNAIGYMGGFVGRWIKLKGVAESIHYVDSSIEMAAKKTCRSREVKEGHVFLTEAGKLKCKYIFHAVTMENPGQNSSLEVVEKCIKQIISFAEDYHFTTIAVPYLGCGTGRVDKGKVRELYEYHFKNHPEITFLIVDKPVKKQNRS
ncbi:macro domain-containing protein [Bacillus sp. Au-Bac7]|uniref:macro domain-containing protein n=1 Tax=Bacillus sp. Au-Bac7 TaxID=2906458 RepID=UPI001E604762|nr:macro domain-containing protein [Bacillus sp. Au-Bac7]MCE4051666.1 macro domain-containing protein [Bacillus sp. Au-Bac7]